MTLLGVVWTAMILIAAIMPIVEMAKRVEPPRLNPNNLPRITHGLKRGGVSLVRGSTLFFSVFIFFYKIHSYIVDCSYTLWTILLIINLYFIIDIINLWSVNFLMYLGLNIS